MLPPAWEHHFRKIWFSRKNTFEGSSLDLFWEPFRLPFRIILEFVGRLGALRGPLGTLLVPLGALLDPFWALGALSGRSGGRFRSLGRPFERSDVPWRLSGIFFPTFCGFGRLFDVVWNGCCNISKRGRDVHFIVFFCECLCSLALIVYSEK